MVIDFIKTYWKQFAIAGIVAFLFLFGYYKGYEHEKKVYQAHLATDERLTAIAKADSDRKIHEANLVSESITKEYADAVAKINTYYKSHPNIVRMCNSGTGGTLSTQSQSSSGNDETIDGTAQITSTIDMEEVAKEITQCELLIKFEQEQEGIQ